MKLLRTIRLDPSDSFVFDKAAEPGEWALPGAFEFWNTDMASLGGKQRQAFRAGFLGLSSFGWSTLVVAVEASAEDRESAVESLAAHFIDACGAPDREAALQAAEQEIAGAEQLADHPAGTLIALHRTMSDDGNIGEQFRTLRPDPKKADACTAWTFEQVEEPTDVADAVDLAALARSGSGGPQ